jgi:hypothetical protein
LQYAQGWLFFVAAHVADEPTMPDSGQDTSPLAMQAWLTHCEPLGQAGHPASEPHLYPYGIQAWPDAWPHWPLTGAHEPLGAPAAIWQAWSSAHWTLSVQHEGAMHAGLVSFFVTFSVAFCCMTRHAWLETIPPGHWTATQSPPWQAWVSSQSMSLLHSGVCGHSEHAARSTLMFSVGRYASCLALSVASWPHPFRMIWPLLFVMPSMVPSTMTVAPSTGPLLLTVMMFPEQDGVIPSESEGVLRRVGWDSDAGALALRIVMMTLPLPIFAPAMFAWLVPELKEPPAWP